MCLEETVIAKWNPKYRTILTDNNRFLVLYGGAGSGKSYSIAQKIITEITSIPDCKYLAVRKVGKTLRFSVFALLQDIIEQWQLSSYFHVNKTDMTIEFLPMRNRIICIGLDNVEKLKSIVDVKRIWIEEASEITQDDFQQLNLRMRGESKISKQILMSFNPIHHLHWLKEYFFDNPKPNTTILHSTYKDNEFLDAEYKQELENLKEIDPYFYDVYCLGKWGILGNRVFTNFVIENFSYQLEDLENVCHGQDYGFNHASTLISLGFKDGDIYVFDEQYYKEHTNPEFIERVNESGFARSNVVTADSSEPARIKEWQKAGYNVRPARKGKDSLLMGIDWLKAHRIHIHATNCPNTAREIQLLKYREDKDGNVLEEIVELDDDCIAAMRYATEWLWNVGKGKFRTLTEVGLEGI